MVEIRDYAIGIIKGIFPVKYKTDKIDLLFNIISKLYYIIC